MAFISQHCSTPAQLPVLLEFNILDISLNLDWVNLNDDVMDFLLAAAEHTNAPPVGLHDSDTILGDKTSTQCVIKRTFRFQYKGKIQFSVPFPELPLLAVTYHKRLKTGMETDQCDKLPPK